jgi:hypothetical protein
MTQRERALARLREHRLREARARVQRRSGREPDFYTGGGGSVHPIRDSPGYSETYERRRALLRRLDAALARQHGERRASHAELEEEAEEWQRRVELEAHGRSYGELKREVLAEGGLRPDRDYGPGSMPRDLVRAHGVPPDEMAPRLGYDSADEMLADLRRRRRALELRGRLRASGSGAY